MARKSNKTSHVLHLLAGEEPVPEAPEEKAASPEKAKEEAPAEDKQKTAQPPEDAPNISIIPTGNSEGDALADLIKDQLEEAFPEEILNPPPASAAPDGQLDIAKFGADGPAETTGQTEAPPEAETPAEPAPAQTENAAEPTLQSGGIPMDDTDSPAPQNVTANSADDAEQAQPTEQPEHDPALQNTDADSAKPQTEEVDASNTLPSQTKEGPSDAAPVPDAVSDEEANAAQESEGMDEAEEISTEASDETAAPQIPEADTAPKQQPEQSTMSKAHLDSVLCPDKDTKTHNYQFVNVMEYIIKDMVIDYMNKFDMCTCERCVVDTTALALTGCPAKYIVVDSHSVSPLLNYYANRYVGDVTVELTKACTLVKENPRH